VIELDLTLTASRALDECRSRGLVVAGERSLAGRPDSRHWHPRFPDRPGTLELSESDGRTWVKVHPNRAGGWAPELARTLAAMGT
jgi:hypothetical protein